VSILEKLNAKTLELRKSRDELAPTFQSVQAATLANAKLRGLDAGATDDDAVLAINKAIKNVSDMANVLIDQDKTDSAAFARAEREKDALELLLPARVSEDEVRLEVAQALLEHGPELSMKMMGPIMKHLETKYGAALDKKAASSIVQSLLKPAVVA
jgi:uncharacterized protein YqeY